MYEIIRGLFIRNLSSRKFIDITDLFENIKVLSLDDNAIIKSAEISADLMKKGTPVPDCDCLTAGISLSKGVNRIVTNNVKHFKRIKELRVETH